MNEQIRATLKTLPEQPGVYLMHGGDDTVIYVGKAKILKNRVRQYFQSSQNHTPKVRAMVEHIRRVEYIVTDSETEALMLECNLIKKYRPKYNILLKDDKHYPFLKIQTGTPYPRISMTRRRERDSGKYYGPYVNAAVARETLELLRKLFGLYSCSRVFPRDCGKGRPCLYYHMKQCVGVCTGKVTPEEYQQAVARAAALLEGKTGTLREDMTREMYEASERMEFERAAHLRDSLRSLEQISEKQKMLVSVNKEQDYVACARDGEDACVQVFFVRDGKVLGREHYSMKGAGLSEPWELLSDFVKQFYHGSERIPKEILLQEEIEDQEEIARWLSGLRGSRVKLSVPRRGEGRAMMEMAARNAAQSLENIRNASNKTKVLLMELKEELHLPILPRRIESYDISNTAGADSVGGMVVFIDGAPLKKAYRKFKIQSVEGPNDYASTCEVIYRRLRHGHEEQERIKGGSLAPEAAKFFPLPDLILLDGGAGHVNAVSAMLGENGWNIPLLGMVKDDRHRTRAITNGREEFSFGVQSRLFRFFVKIQEEVHRYAITYHRSVHKKKQLLSALEEIPGIGAAKRTALLRHFGSAAAVKRAGQEELRQVKGISPALAEQIYQKYHKS